MRRVRVFVVLVVLAFVLVPIHPAPTHASNEFHAAVSGLRAAFVPNVGQADPDVLFEGGLFGRSVSVTNNTIVFADGNRLEFATAGSAVRVRGVDRATVTSNFLYGDDPDRWRTNVPNYRAVRYENIVPGVDVVVRFSDGGVTAAFQAIAIRDLEAARVRLVDASGATLYDATAADAAAADATGFPDRGTTLELHPDGHVSHGGTGPRVQAAPAVAAIYYAAYLGGGRDDSASAVAVDSTGAAYVTGTTRSINFPVRNALQDEIASGSLSDAFVAKIDAEGTELVYSTYLGGNRADHGRDIAVDAVGRAHIVGYTESRDFPTASAIQDTYGGGTTDGFIAVLSHDGSGLDYGSYLGGRDADHAQGVAIGPLGPRFSHTFVVGSTKSTDFPSRNAFQPRMAGDEDAFLTVLAATRSEYAYSTYLGGTALDSASAVAVDDAGSAYLTGYTQSNRFPTQQPMQGTLQGDSDAFVTKLAPHGSALEYSTYLGGRDMEEGLGIAVHNLQAVVTGYTASTNFPTEQAFQAQLRGSGDGFVSRLAPTGAGFVYSTFLGGTSVDRLHDVVVDPDGVVHVVGSSESANFPVSDPVQAALNGPMDAVLAALSADGARLISGTYFGGSRTDAAYGLAGGWNSMIFAGYTESADMETAGGIQDDYAGQGDAFVARLRRMTRDYPTETPVPGPACAIHQDPRPRRCPGGLDYEGWNGGFEEPRTDLNAFDHWYNSFDARRARGPFPVMTGMFSLALNPYEVSVVSNGRIVHDLDLGQAAAPPTATLSVGFQWDGYGSVKLTAELGGQGQQTIVDTTVSPPEANRWQTESTQIDRAALTGVSPLVLRWTISGRARAFIDNVDVNYCCGVSNVTPSATPTQTGTPTTTPTIGSPTPTDEPTEPATPATSTATLEPEPGPIYLPHVIAP